jgi:formylglycine-generating enzyme required for sulfatase activity
MKTQRGLLLCFTLAVLGVCAQGTQVQLLPANTWDSNKTHQVVWETTPGVRYQLEQSANLTNDWMAMPGYPVEAIQYADAYAFNILSNTANAQFFRVVKYDEQAPYITDRFPDDGDFAIPRFDTISVSLSDASGIDPASVSMSVGDLGIYTVADAELSFTNNALLFDHSGDTALGGYGESVSVTLVAADVNGYAVTNEWTFDLEVAAVVADNVFVFGSPEAQRAGQRIGAIPTRVLAERAAGGPIRMAAGADEWELHGVETNALVISYSGAAPALEVGAKLANLTPASVEEVFYREVTGLSDDALNGMLTLFTQDISLEELVTDGSLSISDDSVILETGFDGTIVRTLSLDVTLELPEVGFSLDGSKYTIAPGGYEAFLDQGDAQLTVCDTGYEYVMSDEVIDSWGTLKEDGWADALGAEFSTEEFHFWLSPKLETSLEISWGTLKRFSAIAIGDVDAAMVCSLSTWATFEKEATIFDLPEKAEPSHWLYLGNIGAVPVYAEIRVDMTVDTDFLAHADMSLHYGVRQHMSAEFGVEYDEGTVDWVRTFIIDDPEIVPFSAEVNGELGAGLTLKPRVEVLVYGLAGVSTGPSIRGGARLELHDTELSGYLEGSASWELSLAGPAFDALDESLDVPIWEDEWKLFPEEEAFSFTRQPQGLTVDVGDSAYFSCAVSPNEGVTYQWYYDGVLMPGETQRTLLIPYAEIDRAGEFFVLVSDGHDSLLSEVAELTVTSSESANVEGQWVSVAPNGLPAVVALEQTGNAVSGTIIGSDFSDAFRVEGSVIGTALNFHVYWDRSSSDSEIDFEGSVDGGHWEGTVSQGSDVWTGVGMDWYSPIECPESLSGLTMTVTEGSEVGQYVFSAASVMSGGAIGDSEGTYTCLKSASSISQVSIEMDAGETEEILLGFITSTNGVACVRQFLSDVLTSTRTFEFELADTVDEPQGMVLIPAGTNSGTDPDFGAYSLTVDSFYMDATEVTKGQWDTVYSWAVANGYSFDNAGSGKASNYPVHWVNWYDCVKWCNARSQMDGKTPCYTVSGSTYKTGQSSPDCDLDAGGYRLPTSDEWEYAARGGLSGKRFPWGDTINHSKANYGANGSMYSYDTSPYTARTYHPSYDDGGYPYTSPAGSFSSNGYGLYDMAGNVWEWCDTSSGSLRLFRGGCWYDLAAYVRCGYESASLPAVADHDGGFRSVSR